MCCTRALRYDRLGDAGDTGSHGGGAGSGAQLISRRGLGRRGVREPRAPERVRGGEPAVRPARQEPAEDVEACGRERREHLPEAAGGAGAAAEPRARARQPREARPGRHVLHPQRVEDAVELVHLRPPREERRAGEELGHDAAERPGVDARVVLPRAEDADVGSDGLKGLDKLITGR